VSIRQAQRFGNKILFGLDDRMVGPVGEDRSGFRGREELRVLDDEFSRQDHSLAMVAMLLTSKPILISAPTASILPRRIYADA
jgi:hypothetical protein